MLEGGGLKLKLKEHYALYKAALVMHLHRLHNSLVNGRCGRIGQHADTSRTAGGSIATGLAGACEVPCQVTLR